MARNGPCRKKRYHNPAEAGANGRAVKRSTGDDCTIHVYYCDPCKGYHWGRRLSSLRKLHKK